MPPPTAYPGVALGPSSKYAPGPGTHVHEGQIYASLAGSVITTPSSTPTAAPKPGPTKSQPPPLPQLSVARPAPHPGIPSRLVSATNTLPAVNDVVLARVARLQTRQITVAILVVGEAVCADSFAGVVRKEDVRGWEVDRVVLGEGFRVGDVIRGVVVSGAAFLFLVDLRRMREIAGGSHGVPISLGDQASYYLSTARNELGVIMATSEDGNTMYPISWKEFRDPVTGRTESRKVAKPF
ncbi:exosome 3'-_5 exonuclease subunit ski4 (Csl4) [Xylographa bjoerkii]|nr:exosome 3'->5 exonuclease subunit ski4 (Csl4) [Xylographa bjoerkii]MCJ1395990.1 exosome 3'->5 exonuclease subunit ski4 (Csl4) [Xylographa bjoerkii]MCJ1395999.1 exosome 3'->5 exonuclease subunit ski4 (Csl4) [Xylographa bjoerkii]